MKFPARAWLYAALSIPLFALTTACGGAVAGGDAGRRGHIFAAAGAPHADDAAPGRHRRARRHGGHGRTQGQAGLFEGVRRAEQGRRRADDRGVDLSHLLHDQTRGVGGGHDAGRRRAAHAGGADRQVHPRVQGHEGRGRELRSRNRRADLLHRARQAPDHGAGSAAPHLRAHLRCARAEDAGEDALQPGQHLFAEMDAGERSARSSPNCRCSTSRRPCGNTATRPTCSAA